MPFSIMAIRSRISASRTRALAIVAKIAVAQPLMIAMMGIRNGQANGKSI
jgi:hypothetical protein